MRGKTVKAGPIQGHQDFESDCGSLVEKVTFLNGL